MKNEKKDKLKEQYNSDIEKLECLIKIYFFKQKILYVNIYIAFGELVKELKIPVEEVNADRDIESVFKTICFKLKPFLQNRINLLEKH